MDFSDIINDLVKLEDIRLNSIRPGAEITIKQVDIAQKKVVVESSSGKLQSRSFLEFQRIWEALLSTPAIRVEEVLKGSGSSRNQPETIFANLPYIQWLKLNNKKHIAYVGKATHPYGTIQQMDSMQAAQIIMHDSESEKSDAHTILIVTNDVSKTANELTSVTGRTSVGCPEGYYVYYLPDQTIILADASKIGISCGTYPEIKSVYNQEVNQKVHFAGSTWAVVSTKHVCAIIRL